MRFLLEKYQCFYCRYWNPLNNLQEVKHKYNFSSDETSWHVLSCTTCIKERELKLVPESEKRQFRKYVK